MQQLSSHIPSIDAVKYKTLVQMNIMRPGTKLITEIFIYSHSLVVNSVGGVFPCDHPRNTYRTSETGPNLGHEITEIKISCAFLEEIQQISKFRLQLKFLEDEWSRKKREERVGQPLPPDETLDTPIVFYVPPPRPEIDALKAKIEEKLTQLKESQEFLTHFPPEVRQQRGPLPDETLDTPIPAPLNAYPPLSKA